MTIVRCPHGCGGLVDTAVDDWCPSCRRGLSEAEVVIPESAEATSPVTMKERWCWRWHGPAHHRMRCRLPVGHDGECFDHEERPEFDSMIVSTRGDVIAAALADKPPKENGQ